MPTNPNVNIVHFTKKQVAFAQDGTRRTMALANSAGRAIVPAKPIITPNPNNSANGTTLGQFAKPKEGGIK